MEFTKEELENEVWKDIPYYEGLYQASDLGRVRSLNREVSYSKGVKRLKGKILKERDAGKGYKSVALYKDKKGVTKRIHQLVAMSFLFHKPNRGKKCVDHINNNAGDNRLINLQIISTRENTSKDKKGYSSKHVGVSKCKTSNKWKVHISTVKEGQKYLGLFDSEEQANKCYQEALYKVEHGEKVDFTKKKYKGVSLTPSNTWQASIRLNGKNISLGVFKEESEAIEWRKQAEISKNNKESIKVKKRGRIKYITPS